MGLLSVQDIQYVCKYQERVKGVAKLSLEGAVKTN